MISNANSMTQMECIMLHSVTESYVTGTEFLLFMFSVKWTVWHRKKFIKHPSHKNLFALWC